MKNDKIKDLKSSCCNAEVTFDIAPDFIGDKKEDMTIGTCCFKCKKCGKFCDIVIDVSNDTK